MCIRDRWYSFPQTSEEQIEAGYQRIKELWSPIMDVYDEYGVKLALEVHPTEIAFDYWSTKRLLETIDYRPTLGLNFDPSHLLWQGVNPAVFLRDFADRIYHVHMKDVKINRDDRAGILGSHIEFGDTRRGWNFVCLLYTSQIPRPTAPESAIAEARDSRSRGGQPRG